MSDNRFCIKMIRDGTWSSPAGVLIRQLLAALLPLVTWLEVLSSFWLNNLSHPTRIRQTCCVSIVPFAVHWPRCYTDRTPGRVILWILQRLTTWLLHLRVTEMSELSHCGAVCKITATSTNQPVWFGYRRVLVLFTAATSYVSPRMSVEVTRNPLLSDTSYPVHVQFLFETLTHIVDVLLTWHMNDSSH